MKKTVYSLALTLALLASLCVSSTVLTGCTSVKGAAYASSGAIHTGLDVAWQAWMVYEKSANPSQDLRIKVQSAFLKANASLLVLIDAERAASSGDYSAISAQASQDFADVQSLLTSLNIKL